jgi:DNA-binding HxlR family transcriptional regulator
VARVYGQHCGLAQALDLVGERWALLIVRELMAGPRRYTDLADGLVTAPSNVLAGRLRELQAAGLIARRRMPSPAASTVYELTDRGHQLEPAVTALARWGMQTMPAREEGRPFRAHWLVLALRARFDHSAAAGLTESYEFEVPGEATVSLTVEDGKPTARLGSARQPAVRIVADAETLIGMTEAALDPAEALERGALIEGDPAAVGRLAAILPPP